MLAQISGSLAMRRSADWDGRVAGLWSSAGGGRGKRLHVAIAPFEKLSSLVRARVEEEAECLGVFLGLPAEVRWSR